MRPIPNLSDVEAMAARGRRGALLSARNEAAEEARALSVAIQSAEPHELGAFNQPLRLLADRLSEIADLWDKL